MGFSAVALLVLGSLWIAATPTEGASNGVLYTPGLNGVQLCGEPDHMNGGPSTPLYNYASNGDDWKGVCKSGLAQSPIDLNDKNASALRSIESSSQLISFGSIVASGNAVMRLEVDEVELISGDWNRTGFTIPVCGTDDIGCLMSSNTTSVQQITPNISNLHFHANSEHTRDGKDLGFHISPSARLYYGAEAHLVTNLTVNGKYHLVVFGVWMDLSGNKTNSFYSELEPYVDFSEGADCAPVPDNTTFQIDSLFPTDKSYYGYSGSLTTPPCSEGVTWIVFTNPVKISIPQVKSLYKSSAHIKQPCAGGSSNQVCDVFGARTNNRPLQPQNGRIVSVGKFAGNSDSS